MEELIQLILRTYGIAGLLLLLPVVAMVVLWRQNKALHDEVVTQTNQAVEAQKQRVEDQNKRVADNERMMQRLMDVVREQTVINTEVRVVLERLDAFVDRSKGLSPPPTPVPVPVPAPAPEKVERSDKHERAPRR